ncbi:hypothetical protein J6590_074812 [Homalodisca vitripennis]|nr:hypothetical protein J6590_074812 [Homalodisca vitripennis]
MTRERERERERERIITLLLLTGEQRNIYNNLEKRITSVASHNRLIVATLPHRNDLPSTHDINQHTSLRKHFTRHGMHLQIRGKSHLARLIVEALGGLSTSTAATEKAEVALDTRNSVSPPAPPPPPLPPTPPSRPPFALPSRPRTDSPPPIPEPFTLPHKTFDDATKNIQDNPDTKSDESISCSNSNFFGNPPLELV